MSTISSVLPAIFSAVGEVKPADDAKGEKGDAKEDDKAILQQRKSGFLEKYIAAIMDGDFKTAIKLRVELAKLDRVGLPEGQKVRYTALLEKLRNGKGESYEQLLASVAEEKDPPAGINSKIAKADIVGNIIQEALGLPKKKLELSPAIKIQYQARLEKISQEKAKLYDQLLAAAAEGKNPPADAKQKIATIDMMGSIMNEALGNSKKGVALPRVTTLKYQGMLDKLPSKKGDAYDKVLAAVLEGKLTKSARGELTKVNSIGAVLQKALGCPNAKIPIDRERAARYQSQYEQASQEHSNLQGQLLSDALTDRDPPPGIRARMANLSIYMGVVKEAVSNNK